MKISSSPSFSILISSCLLFLVACKSTKNTVDSSEPQSFRVMPAVVEKSNNQQKMTDQNDVVYFDKNYMRNQDHVYRNNIGTPLLYKEDKILADPILYLDNESDFLTLRFDDLDAERNSYNYKIQHCNANWEPSDLAQQEYMNGFTTDLIDNPESSENTLQHFTHYSFKIPNDNFKLTKSGNYLVHILLRDSLILTKRFMVLEGKIGINMDVHAATMVKDRDFKQEVDFVITHAGYQILDPYKSLKVVVIQNNRLDNRIVGIQPNFVKDGELHYNYQDINVFEGGNEFRPLDLKNTDFNSSMIDKFIVEKDRRFHAYLLDDELRSYRAYTFNEDLNGKFIIKKDGAYDNHLESDYIKVHFQLPYDLPETEGDIYMMGAFTQWQLKDTFKLRYNYEAKRYEKELMLKQGYYNYQYAYLKDRNKKAELFVVEGSHQETENDYSIRVYYRQPGDNYDRLIGIQNLNSKNTN